MLLVGLRRLEYRGYDAWSTGATMPGVPGLRFGLSFEMLGMNIDCSTTWGDE